MTRILVGALIVLPWLGEASGALGAVFVALHALPPDRSWNPFQLAAWVLLALFLTAVGAQAGDRAGCRIANWIERAALNDEEET